jgi:hypothetical protein
MSKILWMEKTIIENKNNFQVIEISVTSQMQG